MTVNKLTLPSKENAVQSKVNEIIDNLIDGSNLVTTNTAQSITETKTFVGSKKVAFKQSSNNDKLGFTLYTSNNTEKGYLEFNPTNTVDSVPLMTLGNYASASGGLTHVGFRKYSSVSGASGAYNLLTPLISDAKTPFSLTTTYTNFYLPLGFTDGTTTVTTAKSGMVDLSSIIPTEVTETTVVGWGFTKNVGTVTSVNNVAPINGDVSLTIPTDTKDLTNGAGFITGITSSDVATALGYTPLSVNVDNVSSTGKATISNLAFPDYVNYNPSDDMALPASDTVFTPTQDGILYLLAAVSAGGSMQFMADFRTNQAVMISRFVNTATNAQAGTIWILAPKGVPITLRYTGNLSTSTYRFIPTIGGQ